MVEIIPAIIGENFRDLKPKIEAVEGLVNWVQLDVADGLFAPNWTWHNPDYLKTLDGKLKLEVHLMVEEPEAVIADWLPVVDRVLVHYEATKHLAEIITQFKTSPVKLGLAVLLDTPLEKIEPELAEIKHLQLMGISQIGFQGQPLEEIIFTRLKTVREKFPDVTIAVDGGVTLANAEALIKAGANQLVIGSAIWESGDIITAIKKFQNVI